MRDDQPTVIQSQFQEIPSGPVIRQQQILGIVLLDADSTHQQPFAAQPFNKREVTLVPGLVLEDGVFVEEKPVQQRPVL